MSFQSAMTQPKVSVDKFTGTGYVSVPLVEMAGVDLFHGVSLNYSTNGIKPDNPSGELGTGWSLMAGGVITRVVQDLPDDYYNPTESKVGWLHNNQSGQIGNFSITGDGTFTNCSDEAVDYTVLNGISDTSPDVFYVNTNGLSGKFLFNNNDSIISSFNENVKIEYTLDSDPANQQITSFVITKDNGVKYYFTEREFTTEHAIVDSITVNGTTVADTVDNFLRYYKNYSTAVSYYSKWFLTSIENANSSIISFEYQPYEQDTLYTNLPVESYTYSSTSTGYAYLSRVRMESKVVSAQLSKIVSEYHELEFNFAEISFLSGVKTLKERKLASIVLSSAVSNEVISRFQFDYFAGQPSYDFKANRTYLKSINSFRECITRPPITFEYYGVKSLIGDRTFGTDEQGNPIITSTTYYYRSALPYNKYYAGDFWGYLNSINTQSGPTQKYFVQSAGGNYFSNWYDATDNFVELEGKSGNSDPTLASAGLLKSIHTSEGGRHSILYEPNEFFNEKLNITQQGAGVRVVETIFHDGRDHQNDMVHSYSYYEGQLLYLPETRFLAPYVRSEVDGLIVADNYSQDANELIRRMSIRTPKALNENLAGFPNVAYKKVVFSLPGHGSVESFYNIPESYFTMTKPTSHYAMENSATVGRCPNPGLIIVNNDYAYPYAPVTDNFDTGVLLKEVELNQSNQLVRKTTYEYQTLYTPMLVKGIKMDYMHEYLENYNGGGDVKLRFIVYSPYTIAVNGAKTLKKQTVITYNSELSDSIQNVVQFLRESPNHKYISKIENNLADGTVTASYLKYAEDYVLPSSTTDQQIEALSHLKVINNLSSPIEEYSSVTEQGSSTTIRGSLDLLKKIGQNVVMTANMRMIEPNNGFVESYIDYSGIPSFKSDNNYIAKQKATTFNTYGQATGNRNLQTGESVGLVYGYNDRYPVLELGFAEAEEVLFSDFESTISRDYSISGTFDPQTAYVTGYISETAMQMKKGVPTIPVTSLDGTLVKKTGNYKFSCWIKSVNSGNLNVVANDGTTSITTTVTFANTTGQWQYISGVADVSSLTDNFSVSIASSQDIDVDNVLLAPESVIFTHKLYDPSNGIIAVRNHNGPLTEYEYNSEGQLLYEKNHNGDIIKMYEYSTEYSNGAFLNALFNEVGALVDGSPITFSSTACMANVSYLWTITDVSTQIETQIVGNADLVYTFPAPGDYNIKLEVNNGNESVTHDKTYFIAPHALQVAICYEGPTEIDLCQTNAILVASCPQISGPSGTTKNDPTKFMVTSVDSNLALTYQWEFRRTDLANNGWGDIGSDQNNFEINFLEGSYQIRCEVIDSQGHTGWSQPLNVVIYESQFGCGQ
ncbi:MAG: hypothetical protein RH948_08900 [Cyclobacteriaceae bacterium]